MSAQYEFDFTHLVEKPRAKNRRGPGEWKVTCLRECPYPAELILVDTPERVAQYWRAFIPRAQWFSPSVECFVVIALNTRRKAIGHYLVGIGTLDTVVVHPREVFRTAILLTASAIVLTHNHPSGDATPSEADIKITRDLIRAGQMLKIEVLDHVICGRGQTTSLRELGYLYP